MSDEFWAGVVVTLLVGIPGAFLVAVLANRYTPRLVHYLETRKLLKTHKTRQQALQVYGRIKAFHDGTRDRYPTTFCSPAARSFAPSSPQHLFSLPYFRNEFPLAIPFGIIVLIATVAAVLTLLILTGIHETARQLERFDDYRQEIEQRWGPIESAGPNPPKRS